MCKIYNALRSIYWNFIHSHFPYFWAKHLYEKELGKKANLANPRDINEKILWLEFFTDTRHWSMLADKYAVRKYVRSCVNDDILIPLLGQWNNIEDIDFKSLPKSFVIKPNNGSYDTIIVFDKDQMNIDDIKACLAHSFNNRFGLDNAEPHYLRIKPCIIAEKLLETDELQGLVDYKIWCFNGNPYCIFVCVDRDPVTHHASFIYYDLHWNKHPEYITPSFRNECSCPRPNCLAELLAIASQLSTGLPQCRVDLYVVKGKIYFGEMTLTSNYGMMPYFTQEILDDMGRHCILPNRTFTDYWYSLKTRYFPQFR